MFFSFLFHLVELYTSIEKNFKQQRIFQPRDSECEYKTLMKFSRRNWKIEVNH